MRRKEPTENDLKGFGIFVLEVVLAPVIFVVVMLLYAITLSLFFSPLPCFAPIKGDDPDDARKRPNGER